MSQYRNQARGSQQKDAKNGDGLTRQRGKSAKICRDDFSKPSSAIMGAFFSCCCNNSSSGAARSTRASRGRRWDDDERLSADTDGEVHEKDATVLILVG